MFSFHELLKMADKSLNLDDTAILFTQMDKEVQKKAEEVWENIQKWPLMDYAVKAFIQMYRLDVSAQKLYLSLLQKYIHYITAYPEDAFILTGKTVKEISEYLVKKDGAPLFTSIVEDARIDLFLYLDVFLFSVEGQEKIRCPLYFGISCTNEKLLEKEDADIENLYVLHFTPKEIDDSVERCMNRLDFFLMKQIHSLQRYLNS